MFVVVMVYFFPLSLSLILQREYPLNKISSSPKSLFSPPALVLFLYVKNIMFFLTMQRLQRSRKRLPFQGKFSIIIHYTYRIVHFLSPNIALKQITDPAYYLVSNLKCFAICKVLFTNFSSNLIFELVTLTLFLIIISNTSLLNPGPKIHGLTCFFQNVQGLITFSSLGKSFPEINKTKITEFQSHIFET